MEEIAFSVIRIEYRLKKLEQEQKEKHIDPEVIELFREILNTLKIIRENKR